MEDGVLGKLSNAYNSAGKPCSRHGNQIQNSEIKMQFTKIKTKHTI